MRLRLSTASETKVGSYFLSQSSIEFVSSGCTLLDCALGGGWPLGRIINLVGDRSTGKTLLAIEACNNFLIKYPKGKVYYLEAEAAFDKSYAAALGMPVDKIKFIEDVNTVEGWFKELVKVAGAARKQPALFVVDSLDGLSDSAEMEREIDKGSFGSKAKKLSETFRRITKKVESAKVILFIISQTRDKIGVMFGEKTTRSGGKALDFYASQIIFLHEVQKLTKTLSGIKRPIGVTVKARVKKNKVGLPYRECQFDILFGYGVDSITSSLVWLSTVKGLERVNGSLTKSNINDYVNRLERRPAEEYRRKIERLDRIVKSAWAEVEQKFLPDRRKYR